MTTTQSGKIAIRLAPSKKNRAGKLRDAILRQLSDKVDTDIVRNKSSIFIRDLDHAVTPLEVKTAISKALHGNDNLV